MLLLFNIFNILPKFAISHTRNPYLCIQKEIFLTKEIGLFLIKRTLFDEENEYKIFR